MFMFYVLHVNVSLSVCLRGRWVDFGGRSTSNSNLENHSNHNFYVTSAARIVPANRPAKP